MEVDSLRGTPLARFTGLVSTDECACIHRFGNHIQQKDQYGFGQTAVNFQCTLCTCLDFTPREEVERMGTPVNKQAENNGYDLGQKFAKVFTVREDAEYRDKVSLGMHFANSQNLSLDNGAAFVNGFVEGLDTSRKARAKRMSLEDKIDLLLQKELEKRLDSPKEEG